MADVQDKATPINEDVLQHVTKKTTVKLPFKNHLTNDYNYFYSNKLMFASDIVVWWLK